MVRTETVTWVHKHSRFQKQTPKSHALYVGAAEGLQDLMLHSECVLKLLVYKTPCVRVAVCF